MQWEFVIALAIAIPIILFPAVFIWYLNIGGLYAAIKDARERRAAAKGRSRAVAEAGQHIAVTAAKAQPVDKEPIGTKR